MRRATLFTAAVAAPLMCFTGCDVDVKEPGRLPNVHVDPGKAPDIEVRGPEIDVKTKEKEVTVPDIDIHTEKVKVKVPDIDVKIPKENDNETTPKP